MQWTERTRQHHLAQLLECDGLSAEALEELKHPF